MPAVHGSIQRVKLFLRGGVAGRYILYLDVSRRETSELCYGMLQSWLGLADRRVNVNADSGDQVHQRRRRAGRESLVGRVRAVDVSTGKRYFASSVGRRTKYSTSNRRCLELTIRKSGSRKSRSNDLGIQDTRLAERPSVPEKAIR